MNKKLLLGVGIFSLLLLFIFLGPSFYDKDPDEIDLYRIEKAPSREHPLGTDKVGRDVLSRLMWGGRVSLSVGLLATMVKVLIALVLGFLAGFFKRLDGLIMRIVDVFMCFPFYVLALSFVAFVGPSIQNLVIIIAFFTFAPATRMIRTEVKTLKEMEFIQISKINGEKNWRLLFFQILPNLYRTILVIFTNSVAQAILMESSLSFLGVGVKEPQSSWGSMLSVTLNVLNIGSKWWMWLPAGVLVIGLTYSIHLMGEGIHESTRR